MRCYECKNADICLDHRELKTLQGCTSGIPDRKIRTNADRIRNMSDEELTDFLSSITSQCESNTSCNEHCFGCDEKYCDLERCLKWLSSEAE